MVTYPMDLAEETKRFEEDLPQLYFRIKNLEDRLVAYFLRGVTGCVVSLSHDPFSSPRFVGATFDEAEAQKYEKFMQNFFLRYKNTKRSTLPRPTFPVKLDVSFGGGITEPFEFPFGEYSDERVLRFCEEIVRRAMYLYRHRFVMGKK